MLPLRRIVGGENFITTWHRKVGNRRGINTFSCTGIFKGFPTWIYRSLGSCLGNYCSFPCGINWFVEGLGLFSHYASMESLTSVYTCNKSMVYYKKGNEVYGTPLVFPITSYLEKVPENNSSLKIFPNPVNGTAVIDNVEKITNVKVYDDQMKAVRVNWRNEDGKIILDGQQLSSGLYLIAITNNESVMFVKMTVAH